MAEISDTVLQQLIDKLTDMVGIQAKQYKLDKTYTSTTDTRSGAASVLGKNLSKTNLNAAANQVVKNFNILGGSAENLINNFKHVAEGFAGGVLLTSLFDGARHLTKSYNDLSNYGQNFGGSIAEMGRQAALAGLPLEEFGKLIEHSSVAAALMANSQGKSSVTLGQLALNVRNASESMGFYGMTIDQVDEMTGDYAETLRDQGKASMLQDRREAASIDQFASEITQFSNITGKSRTDMLRTINAAQRETQIATRFALAENNDTTRAQKAAVDKVSAFMASLPGAAGDQLTTMFTQSFGMASEGMGSYFTDAGHAFSEAGVGQLNDIMDNMVKKAESGSVSAQDQKDFLKQVQTLFATQGPMLKVQAASGNAAAKTTLDVMRSVLGVNMDNLDANAKEKQHMESFTQVMLTLSNTINKLTSSFMLGFYDSLTKLSFFSNASGGTLQWLQDKLTLFGGAVGDLIVTVFSEKNRGRLISTLEAIIDVLEWGGRQIKHVFDFFEFLAKNPEVAAGMTAFSVFFAGKFLKNLIGMSFGVANIKAGVVNVNGGMGGGGNPFSKNPLGKAESAASEVAGAAGGAKSAASAAETAAKDAELVGKDVAKTGLLGRLGKIMGGVAEIPGIGKLAAGAAGVVGVATGTAEAAAAVAGLMAAVEVADGAADALRQHLSGRTDEEQKAFIEKREKDNDDRNQAVLDTLGNAWNWFKGPTAPNSRGSQHGNQRSTRSDQRESLPSDPAVPTNDGRGSTVAWSDVYKEMGDRLNTLENFDAGDKNADGSPITTEQHADLLKQIRDLLQQQSIVGNKMSKDGLDYARKNGQTLKSIQAIGDSK